MPKVAAFEVVSSRVDKFPPGDMEVYSFNLPHNVCHEDSDSPVVVEVSFNVIKANDLKWEIVVNDRTESQFYYSGDFVFTWQLFPDAAQFHPGENQIAVAAKRSGSGIIEVTGIVLHYRIEI
jgi:hypothetical protein